jgi:hypothetical protein
MRHLDHVEESLTEELALVASCDPPSTLLLSLHIPQSGEEGAANVVCVVSSSPGGRGLKDDGLEARPATVCSCSRAVVSRSLGDQSLEEDGLEERPVLKK